MDVRTSPKNASVKALSSASSWLSVPVIVAALTVGGGALGAVITGLLNIQLERQKLESDLVEKALGSQSRAENAKSLKFLVDAGLLQGLNGKEIKEMAADNGQQLPSFKGAFVRDDLIRLSEAKEALRILGLYPLPPPDDEVEDLTIAAAIMEFQKSQQLKVDALLGPETVLALWHACHPKCLKQRYDIIPHRAPSNDE